MARCGRAGARNSLRPARENGGLRRTARLTEIRNILDSLDAAEPGAPEAVSRGGGAPSEERDLIDPELSRELRQPATTVDPAA